MTQIEAAQALADEFFGGRRVVGVRKTGALEIELTFEDGSTRKANGLLAYKVLSVQNKAPLGAGMQVSAEKIASIVDKGNSPEAFLSKPFKW